MSNHRIRYYKMLDSDDIKGMKSCIPGFEVMAAFNPGAHRVDGGYDIFLRVTEAPKIRHEKINHYPPILCSPKFEFDGERIKLDGNEPRVVVDEFIVREDCSLDDPRGIHLNDGSYRLPTISLIRRAWSSNGRRIDRIEKKPAIEREPVIPASSLTPNEEYGTEDPRIVPIDGEYILSTVGPSSLGVVTIFRKTKDLRKFNDTLIVTSIGCKDTFPFPKKINGKYLRVERPSKDKLTKKQSIYISSSGNLQEWGNFRILMSCRDGMFDSDGIGSSAPPIMTDRGWLLIYHGRRSKLHYSNGAVLMDDSLRIIARSKKPLIERRSFGDDEIRGITYVSAAVLEDGGSRPENKTLRVFGGGGDKYPFSAEIPLSTVFDSLEYL